MYINIQQGWRQRIIIHSFDCGDSFTSLNLPSSFLDQEKNIPTSIDQSDHSQLEYWLDDMYSYRYKISCMMIKNLYLEGLR